MFDLACKVGVRFGNLPLSTISLFVSGAKDYLLGGQYRGNSISESNALAYSYRQIGTLTAPTNGKRSLFSS